jgi:deoxyadenosine/deoxycytidine kinase
VYLHQDIDKLKANIKKRGRDYESQLDAAYLGKIYQGYSDFIKNNPQFKVKIIDITNRDFVEDRHDYLWLLDQIQS